MFHKVTKKELLRAQIALVVAICLQLLVLKLNKELLLGPQFVIIPLEAILVLTIGITANWQKARNSGLHYLLTTGLLAVVSAANLASLVLVLHSLIIDHVTVTGSELLVSAVAIFMTNIIVFALWYWEIDSPGMSGLRWSKADQDFQFTQQDMPKDFPGWQPSFVDYLYVSSTNAINFAPADTKPLTHAAKLLMGTQALVSMLTLALVIARSVNILGT